MGRKPTLRWRQVWVESCPYEWRSSSQVLPSSNSLKTRVSPWFSSSAAATLVDHYSVQPAFGYRIETPRRSIVISGDTTYSRNLAALARDADLLIHEAMYVPEIDRLAGENAPALREHLLRSHSTTEQVGMWVNVRDSKETWKRMLKVHLTPKRKPPEDGEGLGVPDTPNNPRPLSGCAAADLDFS
jgi:ribonuclease BN (tRNA processing enzyme)